jgi:DUF4097 and DUF4098 domain-containing protein YvlB
MKSCRPICALVVPVFLALGCTVTLDSQSQIARDEKQFTVSGRPEVHVTTFDGAIDVQSWDKPDVLVQIEKRGPTREAVEALEVKAEQNGNRVDLEVRKPLGDTFTIGFHRSASAKLVVSVPRNADVIARSGDGSIRIGHVTGRVELHTGDGSIRAEDVSGALSLTTGDGSITVDGAEGRLALETGDGSVNVTGSLAGVRLHTGDGSIVYRAQQGVAMEDDWDISTGDGTVSLYLPPTFGAEIDAHTGNGSIGNDLAISAPNQGEGNRHTLKGRLGSGGKQLRIRTGDGAIRLRPL